MDLELVRKENCRSCMKRGEPGKQLWLCKGCRVVRYCDAACQKADWKEHKGTCKRIGAIKSNAKPGTLRVSRALMKWGRQHEDLLDQAAYEALIPTDGNTLERHILRTHGVVFHVKEDEVKLGHFHLISADVEPMQYFLNFYEQTGTRAEFERTQKTNWNTIELLKKAIKAPVQKYVEQMHYLILCGTVPCPRDAPVSTAVLIDWKLKPYVPNWVGSLRDALQGVFNKGSDEGRFAAAMLIR